MKIFKTRKVKTPVRANSKDAGIDFFIPEEFPETLLNPNESLLIPSGIKLKIPTDHALIAFNKSGIAAKQNLVIGACVIDELYQGEVHIDIKNIGKDPQILKPNQKITQFLLLPINYSSPIEVKSLDELYQGEVTSRGEGGFGSSGV